MAWRKIDETPPRPVSGGPLYRMGTKAAPSYGYATTTIAFTVWRCRGCNAWAVTGGNDPGPCLHAACRPPSRA